MTDRSVASTQIACTKCKQSKSLNAFKRRTDRPEKYRSWCRACENELEHSRYMRNKKSINARRVIINRNNPARQKYAHQWYLRNINKVARYSKAWKAANPDKVNNYWHKRHAHLMAAPINDLTAKDWYDIKAAFKHCCAYCGRKMQRLTQDHITPLSKGGSHTKANVVPACSSCNSRKGNRSPLKPVQPLLL